MPVTSNFQLAIAAIILLIAALSVALWFRYVLKKSTLSQPVFTPSGRSFFGQLNMAVRSHCVVFPSIPVRLLIRAKVLTRGGFLLSKLKNDVFDYVICDRETMDVKCLIILSNKSRKTAKKADEFVQLCRYAGLTLLAYEEKPYRNIPALRKQIFTACSIKEPKICDNGKFECTATAHPESILS
ncbi:MAG: DUF2726 domain-containing protein [Endozoicomonas sp. (ex Botrylloides leachii)]|nr:DUF2726 domain-containing protein [Endozoicomonas sp. (ex Botrylloides leachii)]